MPKAAPTSVIVHRIELQETERKMLREAVAANTFAKAVPATLAAGGIALSAWALYWFFDALYDIGEKAKAFVDKTWENQAIPFVKPPTPMSEDEKAKFKEKQESDDWQLWEWMKEAGDSDNWKIPFTY